MNQAKAFGTIAVVLVLALIARHFWIEPVAIGDLCRTGGAPFSCTLRQALIMSFAFNGLGYASVVVGVIALFVRRKGIAILGGSLGAAGLVLYCYDFAVIGFLLSVLTLARQASVPADESWRQNGEREHHA
ncbi:MAG TPA: hypothetical protein VIQ01_09425 [Burkholderiales bacterium]|jgi:hypothetical protein